MRVLAIRSLEAVHTHTARQRGLPMYACWRKMGRLATSEHPLQEVLRAGCESQLLVASQRLAARFDSLAGSYARKYHLNQPMSAMFASLSS